MKQITVTALSEREMLHFIQPDNPKVNVKFTYRLLTSGYL